MDSTINRYMYTNNNRVNIKCKPDSTCEMLILDPLDPAVTITLKLLNSERLFCALLPVLSRASFKIRFTWFSKV